MPLLVSRNLIVYCGIIRIRGGSIFEEFVGTPHPLIYILNEIRSKKFIELFKRKKRNEASKKYSILYK